MKMMVATQATQGRIDGDFAWTLPGELVHLPALECGDPARCGCGRAFAGVASHRATTTAEVVERGLRHDDVVLAVAQSLADGGWADDPDGDDTMAIADGLVRPLMTAAGRMPVGTVVRRRGSMLYTKRSSLPQ